MARRAPAVNSAKAPLEMPDSPRVAIEAITPEVDGGRFPAKRAAGETVVVEADVFAEGHDEVSCVLRYRHVPGMDWTEAPMSPLVNDRWRGDFPVTELGRYQYSVQAWADPYKSWARDLSKRLEAGQDVSVDRLKGAAMVEATARRLRTGLAARRLQEAAKAIRTGPMFSLPEVADGLMELMDQHADRGAVATGRELEVVVEPERTRFSAWYELFPRSWGSGGKHGTFKDVEARLEYVAGMGFDVLYLAPIHPIGRTHRKGRNNSLKSGPKDPGSPWAIGAREGGHKSIHPELGTLSDFKHLVQSARKRGLEVALDIALQCSPDHPYLRDHPEWFARRPDGSIQYAENPPTIRIPSRSTSGNG
jgi:starch synthase (maltosyl-transferring)